MNAVSTNDQNRQIKRTGILLAVVAIAFYFGFMIITGLSG